MRTAKKEMASASTRVTRSRGLSVDESQGAKDGSGVARVTRSKNRNQTCGELTFYFDFLGLCLRRFLDGVAVFSPLSFPQSSVLGGSFECVVKHQLWLIGRLGFYFFDMIS